MRVADLTTQQRRIDDILRREGQLQAASDRVSSGQRIQSPSDAPDEIAQLLRARAQVATLSRRQSGIDNALPYMQATEATLRDISSALLSARQLALQANNATLNPEDRQALAEQVLRF